VIVLGITSSRYLFVGSTLSLIPRGIAGLLIGLWCLTYREAIAVGALYGFLLAFSFMMSGYQGSAPVLTRLPFFANWASLEQCAGLDRFLSVPSINQRERIQSDVIRLLARRIVVRFHLQKIILFGSKAYGQPRPESDIDMLVIMEMTLRKSQQALHIRQYLNPLFRLDTMVYPTSKIKQRLARGDFFLREIFEKSIVLFESADA
jgi:predicted nucleotidyltransferase